MFPLPYGAPYGRLLYALLGLDLALLISGLALGRPDAAQTGRLPRPLRMSLSAILVVAAFLQWRLVGEGTPVASYARWVFLGMAVGLIGDLIMARLIPVPDRLIFGMLAFGLGHVVYVVALAGVTRALGFWNAGLLLPVWVVVTLAGVALWQVLVRKPGGRGAHNAAALVYSLLMACMNAFALCLAIQEARFLPLAAGALLFLISDLLIGNWNLRGHAWKGVNDAVWVTYNLGQMLIVFSVAAAANVAAAA